MSMTKEERELIEAIARALIELLGEAARVTRDDDLYRAGDRIERALNAAIEQRDKGEL